MTLKSLGQVKELVESLGMEISYAYEDLVFLQHNGFLLQFDDGSGAGQTADADQLMIVHTNSEADEQETKPVIDRLTKVATRYGMALPLPAELSIPWPRPGTRPFPLSSMSEKKVIIRRAGAEDINSLTALLKILFSIEEDFPFDEKRQQQGLELMLENPAGCIYVAEHKHKVVGMCSGQLTISTAEGGFSLLVEDVVVEEKWRGNGIAKKMLDRLAEWVGNLGADRMQLLVDHNNGPGLYFYTREGWQPTQLVCLRKYNV